MNPINYKVVETRDLIDLEVQVAKALENGWVCQGGVAMTATPIPAGWSTLTEVVYAQAMVKGDRDGWQMQKPNER